MNERVLENCGKRLFNYLIFLLNSATIIFAIEKLRNKFCKEQSLTYISHEFCNWGREITQEVIIFLNIYYKTDRELAIFSDRMCLYICEGLINLFV